MRRCRVEALLYNRREPSSAAKSVLAGARDAACTRPTPLIRIVTYAPTTIGNTPLVRLQRLPGATINVVLGKLEGNNPAGSVKDRPALSMIVEAEKRGDIKPGRHADRGDVRQHRHRARDGRRDARLPDDPGHAGEPVASSGGRSMTRVRRRARPRHQGRRMEGARDLAERMRARGQGHASSTSSPTPTIRSRTIAARARSCGARPRGGSRTSCPRWARPARSWACRGILKEKNPAITIIGAQPAEGASIPGIRKWPRGVPAEDLRRRARRPHRVRDAAGCRGHDAPARARGGHLRRHLRRAARARSRCASRAKCATRRSCSSSAIAATATCRPACSRREPAAWRPRPRLRHRDGSRCRGHPPRARRCRASCPTATLLAWFAQQRRAATGSDFAPHYLQRVVAIALRAARSGGASRSGRSASSTIPSPS